MLSQPGSLPVAPGHVTSWMMSRHTLHWCPIMMHPHDCSYNPFPSHAGSPSYVCDLKSKPHPLNHVISDKEVTRQWYKKFVFSNDDLSTIYNMHGGQIQHPLGVHIDTPCTAEPLIDILNTNLQRTLFKTFYTVSILLLGLKPGSSIKLA